MEYCQVMQMEYCYSQVMQIYGILLLLGYADEWCHYQVMQMSGVTIRLCR